MKAYCYECGRLMYVGDFAEYAYKMHTHNFCSWSCLRKYEKRKEEEKDARKKLLQCGRMGKRRNSDKE